jgi:transcriptional regulator with XRE-family HTH domain
MTPEELITWRKTRRIRRVWLARYLGVTPMTVWRWERGIHAIPPYLHLALDTLTDTHTPPLSQDEIDGLHQILASLADGE